MSDRFHPLSMEQLTGWVFTELERNDALFGIPRVAFHSPGSSRRFSIRQYGRHLDSPFGVAAGPHSQMAQNLIVAWLCGARFLELKTVQTLDELEVNKPCIDIEDEGYNVEWSQELKVHESYDEYLRAWLLIHALHRHLGMPGDDPGMIFNMSVGYNLEGILQPNVQWFLAAMRDCSAYKAAYIDIIAEWYPEVREIDIPDLISDTITLSTMHGCPPDEIEKIGAYLLREQNLHTSIKCNPTLLGAERVRDIVNDKLGFVDVEIPDEAFAHDLIWDDAVPMLRNLQDIAQERDLVFGVKLTNTLEVRNSRQVFDQDEMMYMSGRALHAVSTNLAHTLDEEFDGSLLISFAGGADAFNVPHLLRSGIATVTVCSDLLKSGGYLRMLQYFETTAAAMDKAGAIDMAGFVDRAELGRYARRMLSDWRLQKDSLRTDRSKTARPLGIFDCIQAPCTDECPVDQKVPQYMDAVRRGDFTAAVEITRADNPLPAILGQVCDHLCENTCIRTHYDQPLAIRDMKRFIMEQEKQPQPFAQAPVAGRRRVAILGAGPAGLAAAESLAAAGVTVTIFEAHPYAGGMVGGAIPSYRLPQEKIDQDLEILAQLGVEIRYSQTAGVDFTLDDLRGDGFDAIFVAVGAQIAKRLGLPGEEADGILDALEFLRRLREGDPIAVGPRVGVVGAGDTAMDCVRSAYRLGAEATLVYRRTIDQMPADREEIHGALEEGVRVIELAKPHALEIENGKLAGLVCTRMRYHGERDAGGRKIPVEIRDSEFTVPLDTLILAISQHSLLDFFADHPPELSARGYIRVDPDTLVSSIPDVYAGGDVADPGPSSIVKAAADGQRVAASLLARFGSRPAAPGDEHRDGVPGVDFNLDQLLVRRAHRDWRVSPSHTPLDERRSFEQPVLTYTPEEAMAEAARCLDCHEICSLCVGVCPNMALMTYAAEPLVADLPALEIRAGKVVVGETEPFRAAQSHQIAVLTDFCNECGNCVTFCPTAGEPYRDKPRLYLDPGDFEAQEDNAFRILSSGEDGPPVIEARAGGATHRLEIGDDLVYTSPALTARLDPDDLSLLQATAGAAAEEGQKPSLTVCATMVVILRSFEGSMKHLPRASADGPVAGTRIEHPGYAESV